MIGFALQGQIRAYLSGPPYLVPFMPMTSAAFIVFTLYMVPDPATTPLKPWRQVAFGFAVAMVYGVIQMLHLVFGLFFALIDGVRRSAEFRCICITRSNRRNACRRRSPSTQPA